MRMPGFFKSKTANDANTALIKSAVGKFNVIASTLLNLQHPLRKEKDTQKEDIKRKIKQIETQMLDAHGREACLRLETESRELSDAQFTLEQEIQAFTFYPFMTADGVDIKAISKVFKALELPELLSQGEVDYLKEALGRALFAALINQTSLPFHTAKPISFRLGGRLDSTKGLPRRLLDGFEDEKVNACYKATFARINTNIESNGMRPLTLDKRDEEARTVLKKALNATLKNEASLAFISNILKNALPEYQRQILEKEAAASTVSSPGLS